MRHNAGVRVVVERLKRSAVEENRTALMWAAACAAEGDAGGPVAAVTRLLTAAGADVNLQDNSQRTALHWACYMGHAATVEALLAGGHCDLAAADDEGRTALDLAREKNETRCAELLEQWRASPPRASGRRPTGVTPAIARASELFAGRWAASPGRLFAWGKAGGKGGNALPVAADRIDKSGDCCFPAPCREVPGRFVKASVDVGPFVALDGGGMVYGWSGWGETWPSLPTALLPGCVDCAAGAGFIVAAKEDGSVWLLGKAPTPSPLPNASGGTWVEIGWSSGPEIVAAAVVAVDACGGVILAATASGQLLSCGRGPALGLPHVGGGAALLTPLAGLPPVAAFAVGSLHGACAGRGGGADGAAALWCWGDGLSGNLGTGSRDACSQPTRVQLGGGGGGGGGRSLAPPVVHVGCTRGQPRPKRLTAGAKKGARDSFASGQEGPRCHAVTADGGLWIAGTVHKGLGADHLSKTLGTLGSDHLSFYRVGGRCVRRSSGARLRRSAVSLALTSVPACGVACLHAERNGRKQRGCAPGRPRT